MGFPTFLRALQKGGQIIRSCKDAGSTVGDSWLELGTPGDYEYDGTRQGGPVKPLGLSTGQIKTV